VSYYHYWDDLAESFSVMQIQEVSNGVNGVAGKHDQGKDGGQEKKNMFPLSRALEML